MTFTVSGPPEISDLVDHFARGGKKMDRGRIPIPN
jgi:hypothetical protein